MSPIIPIAVVGALFVLSRRGGGGQSMDAVAHSKFSRLHELTGSDLYDTSPDGLKHVVQQFQLAFGGDLRTDGVYDAATDTAVDETIVMFS